MEDSVRISHEINTAEENNVKIEYYTMDGSTKEISMCPGDLMYVCNVLYDYGRIFEFFMQESREQGEEWKNFIYGQHLERCRKIQREIESAMGYSTEEAIEKCRKKNRYSKQEEDVGEDAMVLLVKHMRQKKEQQEKKKAEKEKTKETKKRVGKTGDGGIVGQMELGDLFN